MVRGEGVSPMGKGVNKIYSLRAARIGVFAALYVITSFVPISVFIGASSMLSLNIVITPTIAILLNPIEAGAAALIGSVIALWLAPYQAIFGLTTIFLPLAGAFLGSLVYHKTKIGALLSVSFLLGVAWAYLMARGAFPYWVVPHVLAAFLSTLSGFLTPTRLQVVLSSFIVTMCEQAAMLIQAVYILQLPVIVFMTAFPLMIYERLIGTIGASMIVFGIMKFAPNILRISKERTERL